MAKSNNTYKYNFDISSIPKRTQKQRTYGVTMVMDKGLSLSQVESFCEFHPFVDFVKFGFGTSFISPNLKKKIALYKKARINVFLGGSLFEAFYIRGQVDEYINLLKTLNLEYVEISDGSLKISLQEKADYIKRFKDEGFKVLSEVGKKVKGFQMFPFEWVKHMKVELEAGSEFIITESRESGNVGIYRISGKARNPLINKIINELPVEKVLFEAPQKSQQHFFIDKIGCNVNLGNIRPDEIIALETMRLGLRSDTFHKYL